jgi:hypothetical protein
MQYNKQYDYWADKESESDYYQPIESTYCRSAEDAVENIIDELFNSCKINEECVRQSLKYLCWHFKINNEFRDALNYETSLPINCLER